MATDNPNSPHPFDVKTVEFLIGLMAQHELSEISLQEGEQRIRLRRGPAMMAVNNLPMAVPSAAPYAAPAPSATNTNTTETAPPAPQKSELLEIKSPMVGTFYARPDPSKPPFVSVGSKVRSDTVVCKLEAMKIFNDLSAECNGTIVEICVKDSEPVEFNTVLFRVEPA